MKISNSKASLIVPVICLCITVPFFMLADYCNPIIISGISSIVYAGMFISWFLVSKRLDLYIVFLACTYLFYFGRYFLLFLNYDKYIAGLKGYQTIGFINNVAVFTLCCIIVMHISFVLEILNTKIHNAKLMFEGWKCSSTAVTIVSWVMFGVSYFFTIKVLLMNIERTKIYGYAFALENYYSGYRVERFFSNFLPGAFILLTLNYKNKKKHLLIVYILLAIYLLLYFMSGSRLQAVLLILALLLMYEYEFKHFTKKSIVKLFGFLLALCFLLITISSVRNGIQYSNSLADMLANLDKSAEDNFVVKLLSECGFQIYSIAVVIRECPGSIPFNYGITYLKGIGQLMPNLFWSQNPFMQESVDTLFSYYLSKGNYGIGSSFIAELYYNFGYISVLLMPVFGILFAKYRKMVDKCYSSSNTNIMTRFFLMSIPTYVLFYVRSDAVGFLKSLVYQSIAPCVAILIITFFLRRRDSNV